MAEGFVDARRRDVDDVQLLVQAIPRNAWPAPGADPNAPALSSRAINQLLFGGPGDVDENNLDAAKAEQERLGNRRRGRNLTLYMLNVVYDEFFRLKELSLLNLADQIEHYEQTDTWRDILRGLETPALRPT